MQRYAEISNKIPREIVLLRGYPCAWSKCTFCDYIDDNTPDTEKILAIARENLNLVTGRYGRLEIINSGSFHELPREVWELSRVTIQTHDIRELICEAWWGYRSRLHEIQNFFPIPVRVKIGVETFDHALRNDVLKKGMVFESPDEVAALTDSICLLVGFKGQTRDSVRTDIDILLNQFRYGCINLFTTNRLSESLLDQEIKEWFREEYSWLETHETIEVLWENTDFGIG